MARRNANLAGLAALGALGYKLSQGKGAPVEDRVGVPVSKDDQDFAAMDAAIATMRPQRGYEESEPVISDDGTVNPIMRRNTQSGDLYYPGGTPAAPAKPKAKAKPQPKYQDDTINPDVKQGYKYRLDKSGNLIGPIDPNDPSRMYPFKPRPLNTTISETEYKKGGKVKKMASGGMTSSASKRADGIATKGKTKCKMY